MAGGGSGLGAANDGMLAASGARVVVADLKGEVPEGGRFVETDVTDEGSVRAAVETALELGEFRGAVNCAGIASAEKVLGEEGPHSLDSFSKVVQVNLIGTFNVIRLAAEAMSSNDPLESGERGVIVNTASVAAFDGQIGQVAYAASKGGVVSLTLPVARELAGERHSRHDHSPRHLRYPDDGRPPRRRPRSRWANRSLSRPVSASPRSTRRSSNTSSRTRCSTAMAPK